MLHPVLPYLLLLGAGIGSFIYEFVPADLLGRFAGASIPEVSLLASIFKKKMVIAFLPRWREGFF